MEKIVLGVCGTVGKVAFGQRGDVGDTCRIFLQDEQGKGIYKVIVVKEILVD